MTDKKSNPAGKTARAKAKKTDSANHSNTDSAAESAESTAEPKTAAPKTAETAKAQKLQNAAEGVDSPSNSSTDSVVDSPAADAAAKDPLAELSADELRELLKRTAAERDNVARRAMQEIQKSRRVALNQFAKDICEVCDSLQAALENTASAESNAENNNMREGVELTLRKLLATMEASGIRPVRPDVGAAFDTALHEAIGINNEVGKPANTVAQVVRAGYTLDGQVVRAAQIIVYQPGN